MGTDVIKSYDLLQQELDRAKNTLVTLNDNIRRIIGRDPKETNLRGDRKRHITDSRRKDILNDRTKHRDGGGGGGGGGGSPPPPKRRNQDNKSVFSRLSGPAPNSVSPRDDGQPLKPRIFSRVIRELPSREEIVTAQGPDAESRARNRRMFGSLLGTLHKFCQEESRLKKKEEQKAMVEKKVEEQEIKERANLKKERESLFMDRKRKQLEIRKLELKMNRFKDFKIWEESKKVLVHFIRTKSKPPVYFRPKVLNKKTEKLLAENKAAIEKEIEKKRAAFDEEMLEIENRFKLREDNPDYEPHNNGSARNSSKHDRQKSKDMGDDDDDEDDDDDDDDEDEEDDEEDDDDIEETHKQKVQEIESDHEEREVSRVISSSNNLEELSSIQIKIQNDIKQEDIDPTEIETDNSNERTLPSSIIIPNKEIKRSLD